MRPHTLTRIVLGKVTGAVPPPVLDDGMVEVPDVNVLEGRIMYHK